MNWSKGMIIAASSLCLGLGACNMYVIDFENKHPTDRFSRRRPIPPHPTAGTCETPPRGNEHIAFMDSTTAQLDGCRVITGIRLSHNGPFEDGPVNCAIQP
ncbi:MAG: hypothetical protein CM15mP115_12020 [Alphaproteobacteria bacterium]|nr:MAG: hypothetical protein CM15mP115_12020 [Alphaproteobacteria bacterium]